MWTTMMFPLILLSMFSCLQAHNNGSAPKDQVNLQFNDMDYALFGYNSLKGCPLTSGRDPGFTLPIFTAEAHVSPDVHYNVSRGVVVSQDVSCVTSFMSKVVETPYDLTKLLALTARLGADNWGPSYSASQNFKKFIAELRQNVLVFSTAVCRVYHVKLLLWKPPSFHSSFVEWLIKLNNTDDEDMYLEFLDTYGTHFVSRARSGASITVVHKMDNLYGRLTEGHVTSAASFYAAELFGQPHTLTSDQQQAANEFRNQVETTTIAVGVPLPYGGNSLTWFTAAKGHPSAIHYDLSSVEVLFTETLMGHTSPLGSYGIDHVRIKNNIVAMKTKYCWTLKREGLLGDCEDTSDMTLLSTKLIGHSQYRAAESADQCLEGCYQHPGCVAVTFCPECRQTNLSSNCQVFSAGNIQRAVTDSVWQTTMLINKLETFVKLRNTTVVDNSSSQSDKPNATSVQDCYSSCIEDATCLALTLVDSPGSLIKCARHSDSLQSLRQETGVTVYFISPLVKKIVRSGQTKDLAPFSMSSDWYNAACVIDDECRQKNSVCFMYRCFCRPGFFFSTNDFTCSATCSNLQSTFTEYPESGIRRKAMEERDGVSLQSCSNQCVDSRNCQSFDFRATGGRCLLYEEISLQAQPQWFPHTSRGWTHYQKNCRVSSASHPLWYNSPCSRNMDCPEPNTQCTSGRCLCRSPFFLSDINATCRRTESCGDWKTTGGKSGVYSIQLAENSKKLSGWCDMDTGDGGWLVFQRRINGSVDFYRNWTQYEQGFGDVSGEFWLGLSNLYMMTKGRQHRLRVDLREANGNHRYAEYSTFRVDGPETNYRLTVSGYSGDAGDSMAKHNGESFSTFDQDNDKLRAKNCAEHYRAGWWYRDCQHANLNGQYTLDEDGITWYCAYYNWRSFRFSEMKMKPA